MSYMVFVEGKQPPTKVHTFLCDAEAEVERLALQPDNKIRKIYIFSIVKTNEPTYGRTWIAHVSAL